MNNIAVKNHHLLTLHPIKMLNDIIKKAHGIAMGKIECITLTHDRKELRFKNDT